MADETPNLDGLDLPAEAVDRINAFVESMRTEASLAFKARNDAQAELKRLKRQGGDAGQIGEIMGELEELRSFKTQIDEQKQIEAGQFEAAKKKLEEAKAVADQARAAAEQKYRDTIVDAAFASASGLFGPSGRTVLPPEVAAATFRKFVTVQEDGTLQVVDPTGSPVQADNGASLSFEEAMEQVIDQWPTRDQLLRGGGKAGSGSSGGSGEAVLPVDRAELVQRANAGDQAAIAALRASQPTGRVTHGGHWDKLADVAATSK